MFVGTSCQIAGLKRFMGRPYEKLLAVDVLCHGVPSPDVYARYLAQQTRKVEAQGAYRFDRLEFRNKEDRGWGTLLCRRITAAKTMANPKRSESRNPLRTICLCGDFCTTSIFGHRVTSVRHAVSRLGAT